MSMYQDDYYILLTTKPGKKKEKGIIRQGYQDVEVLPGNLLVFLTEKEERGQLVWLLELLEPESTEVACRPDELQQLNPTELQLLQAIPVLSERITVHQDKTWLQEGISLREGDAVIATIKGYPDLPGTLRFKGEIKDNKGILFGVELSRECRGKGTSDGTFRKKRYFHAEPDSAIFVALHKIRKDGSKKRKSVAAAGGATASTSSISQYNNLKIGDRIVWHSDVQAEYGIVKWIGVLPDSRNQDITIGVEFDHPVGSGTGKYKNHRLFNAKPQHASLIPINGLMKEEDFISADVQPSAPPIYDDVMKTDNTTIQEQEKILSEIKKRNSTQQSPNNDEHVWEHDQRIAEGKNFKKEELSRKSPLASQKQTVAAQIHSLPKPKVGKTSPVLKQSVLPEKQPPEEDEITKIKGGINPVYEYMKNIDKKEVETSPDVQQLRDSIEPVSCGSRRSGSKSMIPNADPDLEVGSLVEVMNSPPLYGVIRWVGYLPDQKEPVKPIAGLEMEEEISAGTDGMFGTHRLFTCAPRKAFFVPLYKCRKDKRFMEMGRRSSSSGNNFGSLETPDVKGNISPPDSLDIIDIRRNVCGKERGIQGHHNSCYLDATLFSMFYFTTVFDGILYRPKRSDDLEEYDEVRQVIKEGIVNPLRRLHYVRADKVMRLRHLLDKLGNIPGMMSEEKDPEEFMNLLLSEITKADPLLHIRSDSDTEVQHSFLYQLIMEKDERLVLPTTQQLFELSFLQMNIKLKERPSCLIIQMPRFGKDYKMYRRIMPSLELDITDVLDHAPRECIICGDLATFECKECYNTHGAGLNTIAFCEGCKLTSHQHKQRVNHTPRQIFVPREYKDQHNEQKTLMGYNPSIPKERMELFAVVCIQTSHYVSFVKCGKGKDAPWVFFDSMADRMGEQSGYNIPEVRLCEDLHKWLSDDYHQEIMRRTDDKELPEHIRRLLCDAYMCMYQNPEVSMFR